MAANVLDGGLALVDHPWLVDKAEHNFKVSHWSYYFGIVTILPPSDITVYIFPLYT